MKILVSGSSGLVGRELVPSLVAQGHEVLKLVRRAPLAPDERRWNPMGAGLEPGALDGVDAVVHLAGEGIADGRWTPERKQRIRESRVAGTEILSRAIAAEPQGSRPKTLVCASAIGFYGDRGDELLDERAGPGVGFLPDVCRAWEEAVDAARQAQVRVVNLRFGVILSARGGALAKMLLPFKLGLAGRLGSGRQWMSWISLDDAVGVVGHALEQSRLSGPVNAVAPAPVTNSDYTRALGRALHRPTLFPMPAFAARLAFGEMAEALLLASTRVQPAGLEASGYRFIHPDLESALRRILGAGAQHAA